MNPHSMTRRDALQQMALTAAVAGASGSFSISVADVPRATAKGELPEDSRLGELRHLNSYFPFEPSASPAEWAKRREYVKRQMLVASGLWPMPSRPTIEPVIHGRIEREGYTVDRVYFESSPGLLVTGSLYRPSDRDGRMPAILCPHGHWGNGRFHDHGEAGVKKEIEAGAEKFEKGGRHPLQARCVQLARMGCIVFLYDMQGYADGGSVSYQLAHRFAKQRPELSSPDRWGLFSAQSELRLLNSLGLQTWNSIRTLDWITSRDDVDASRLGVTGASGGGTQTFMLAAIDDRIAAAFPAVMVSTAMQGGCTCENATYLRIGTGNIEFAAMAAPRPIAMSGANDWTKEIETKGLPELKEHFAMLGVPDNVQAKWFDFPHNYNAQSRAMMEDFFNRHLKLRVESIVERDFVPLSQAEATVFNDKHPAPEKNEETEVAILRALDEESQKLMALLTPINKLTLAEFRRVAGGALEVMIGRDLPGADAISAEKLSETDHGTYREYAYWLRHEAHGEQLPTIFLLPGNWNREVVVWIGADGKSELYDKEGELIEPVQKLVKAGLAVASVDVLYTGEFLTDGQRLAQSRKVDNPREFAGYTLGYNHPLFSQRVHDVLSLISYVKNHRSNPSKIHLVGLGGAGALSAAAGAIAGEALSSIAVSTDKFRFRTITDIRDVNLLPGAVKYGDVPFLLALCAPTRMWLSEGGRIPMLTAATYQVSGAGEKLMNYVGTREAEPGAVVEWLLAQS